MARRKRRLKIKPEEIVQHVLDVVSHAQDERTEWLQARTERYAKYRGWVESRTWPWTNASNQHIPLMFGSSLRAKAGLFNAVVGLRPVMEAKTMHRTMKEAGEKAAALIDYQVFMESEGEERISQWIDQFVDDGTVVAHSRYVRDMSHVFDSRILPHPGEPFQTTGPPFITDLVLQGREIVSLVQTDEAGRKWTVTLPASDPMKDDDLEVVIEFHDMEDDRKLEVFLDWEAVTFDGPTFVVHELEDVVVPMRSQNLQPVTPQNPFGAPWAARLCKVTLDQLKRGREDGTYEYLTKEDMATIEAQLQPRVPQSAEDTEDALKSLKDQQAGLSAWAADQDRTWMTMVEWYGRWDANGDGFDEDVIIWVLREPRLLARGKYLTELYPSKPPRRPFGEARYIPVPGQFYGVGLLEMMEGLHDFVHVMLNQSVDAGTLANVPPFFYRAASGLKPDILRYSVGEGIPLDNPQQDIFFPQIPGRDQGWALDMVGLGIQLLDRLTQIGPIQQGQVPTGKASALRTVGTTMAILQQGAEMPEQILRRCFSGLAQIWSCFHALNHRFLPRKKQFLIAGKPADSEDAYGLIKDPDQELDLSLGFDFQATLLNTNKGLMAQALMSVGSAIVSPLFLQLGLSDPEKIYLWAKDLATAHSLDPSRYLKRPPGVSEGPRVLAEEAITLIMNGQLPPGGPVEPAQEHMQKLMQFMQSDNFGFLDTQGQLLFRQWLQLIQQQVRAEMQQAQQMQAAAQLSQSIGQGGGGDSGVMSLMQAPEIQQQQGTDREARGAEKRG